MEVIYSNRTLKQDQIYIFKLDINITLILILGVLVASKLKGNISPVQRSGSTPPSAIGGSGNGDESDNNKSAGSDPLARYGAYKIQYQF